MDCSANDIFLDMRTPMNGNAKPFIMIKNFDINGNKGNINIISANNNLPIGDIPPNCFASANIICNSSNNMLNPHAKGFSLVSTPPP